jgi:hypothetical protein
MAAGFTKRLCAWTLAILAIVTVIVSSLIALELGRRYNQMNFDFLYRVKEFISIDKLSSLVKDLQLTADQSTKVSTLIGERGFFKLNQLSLSDSQVNIVKDGTEHLKNIYGSLALLFGGIAAIIVVSSILACIFSGKEKKKNAEIESKNLKNVALPCNLQFNRSQVTQVTGAECSIAMQSTVQ